MGKEVILTQGLPASGKSTWAKDKYAKELGRWKLVSKDDIRATLDNSHWSKDNEKFVEKIRDMIILESLKAGKSVIVHDTNFAQRHFEHVKQLVSKHNNDNFDDVCMSVKVFDTPVEECIKRDLKHQASVGEKVIRDMYEQFLAPKAVEPLVQDPSLPHAYLVDIDGTIADKGDRSPFDWSKVIDDNPKADIINIIRQLSSCGYKIIFFSGRDSVCMTDTVTWIERHVCIEKYDLFMRAQGDMRKDSIVKKEMFDNHIRGKYFVEAVFDDRDQVVDTWRKEIGLTCLQVNYGKF